MNTIAIVGYGYWGPKLVRNFIQNGAFDRVLVCEEDPERLARALRENPGVVGRAAFAEVLADDAVAAVALATPVGSHHPLALAALAAGQHVLVEKPLATTHADAMELVQLRPPAAACSWSTTPSSTTPPSRTDPRTDARRRTRPPELHRLDPHQPRPLPARRERPLGPRRPRHRDHQHSSSTSARAACRPSAPPHLRARSANIGILTLRYPSGLFVHINCSWVSPVKIRHMLIGGDRKMVVYDDLNANEPVKIYDSGVVARTDEERNRLHFEYRAGDVYSPKIAPSEALANLVADFVVGHPRRDVPACPTAGSGRTPCKSLRPRSALLEPGAPR